MATAVVHSPHEQRVLEVRSMLDRAANQIIGALPAHLKKNDEKGERFRRIALSLLGQRGMDKVTPKNFVIGIIRAAEIGLEPDPFYGHLFLIPYGDKLNPQIGYKGIIELAWRSDQVQDIHADVVWRGDKFTYKTTARERILEHEPDITVEHDLDKEEPLAAYAIARLKDGGSAMVVLPAYEVRNRRDRSQGYQYAVEKKKRDNPWFTDPAAMWKKTAVRALAPWIPQCPQLAKALQLEDEIDREGAIETDFTPIVEEQPQQPEPTKVTPLTADDFTQEELFQLTAWLKAGAGMNKAAMQDWLANFQGTKEQALASAEKMFRNKDGALA